MYVGLFISLDGWWSERVGEEKMCEWNESIIGFRKLEKGRAHSLCLVVESRERERGSLIPFEWKGSWLPWIVSLKDGWLTDWIDGW
jgi:hypothetical protein